MSFSAVDRAMMSRALQLAEKAKYSVTPNPGVGAVVTKNEKILGEGFTRPLGENHAEIEALQQAGEMLAVAPLYRNP